MPWYHTLGEIPRKRHTAFRQADGSLFGEHLMGSLGFSGPSTLLYHRRRPTSVLSSRLLKTTHWQPDPDETLRMRHFHLNELSAAQSPTLDRTPVLFNHDVALDIVRPSGNRGLRRIATEIDASEPHEFVPFRHKPVERGSRMRTNSPVAAED